MKDSKKTAQSGEQGFSDAKKLFNFVGNKMNGFNPSSFSFTKTVGKAAVKIGKWILPMLASTVGIVVFVIIIIALLLMLALSSVMSVDKSAFTDMSEKEFSEKFGDLVSDENVFGNVCSAESTKTYKKIEEEYVAQLKAMAQTYATLLKEYVVNGEFPDEVKEAMNEIDYDTPIAAINADTTEIKFSGSYSKEISETEKVEVNIDIPLILEGVENPQEYISTVVGYIQANYGVINMYSGENLESLKDGVSKKQTITTKLGHTTPDGIDVVDESYCDSHNGTLKDGACTYSYIPSKKTLSKTGTCKYDGENWSTDDSSDYSCSDEGWKKKNSSEDNPKDGSTYTYTYLETVDNKEVDLSEFDLDQYNDAVDKYIASHNLFYFEQSEWHFDGYSVKKSERTDEVPTTKTITCTYNGESWNSDECKKYAGSGDGLTIGSSKTVDITDTKEVKVTIYDFSSFGTPGIQMHIGLDSSDKDFLGKEKEATKKNIEKLAEAQGNAVDGETEYNTAIYEMVDILNFLCPEQTINLELVTGTTYSSFGAITGAVNAPGVFGNQEYWYDSSKGVWDVSQLKRQDVYDAIWSYSAYLNDNGLVGGSGWWRDGHQVGTPQCTDFVHARFYAQYGFDCGNGNGKDVARNTVAKYPDKFTTGTINGAVTIKAGSIVSTTANSSQRYGHVGFVEAVETDENGKIKSITVSDANFSKLGAPGGVRLHCVYTWEQFTSAWGLNCDFAVPID